MKAPSQFVEALLNRDFKSAEGFFERGVDVNLHFAPSEWTALHYVVEEMLVDSTRWLLEKRADPNQKDASGWTPLHLAIDAEGDTALQTLGAGLPTTEFTSLLLAHGANPNAVSNNGRTPMALALQYKHENAIQLLQKHGASGQESGQE